MQELGERLEAMVVEVSSPDRHIRARLSAGSDIDVWFVPGTYRRYTEAGLARQLGGLATLVWTGYRQEYRRLVGEATGTPVQGDVWLTGRRADFRQAQAELVVEGISADRSVSVRSTGLVRWEFVIWDGTIARLSEEQFLANAQHAVSGLLAAYFDAAHRLKDEYFGLRLHEAQARTETWR